MPEPDTAKRETLRLLGAGASLAAFGTGTAVALGGSGGHGGETAFEFASMVGNTLTGGDGALRGLDAGGLPWVLERAEAKLETGSDLKVEVEGLVIAPDVDHPLAGTNPVDQFRAVVSCVTIDEDAGTHVVENVRTGTYPASDAGDAEIEETVTLPDPCLAPVVFVTSPGGSWFAVTGV